MDSPCDRRDDNVCRSPSPEESLAHSRVTTKYSMGEGYRYPRSPNELICAAIVNPPLLPVLNHAFGEYHIGNLAGTLPLCRRTQEWLVGAGDQLARIILVEQRPRCGVHKIVVGCVIEKEDAFVGDDRRRPRLHYS